MKRVIDISALLLLIIGGINWGLIGLFNYNVVEVLLGGHNLAAAFVYILVGIAALYYILAYFIWRNQTAGLLDNH